MLRKNVTVLQYLLLMAASLLTACGGSSGDVGPSVVATQSDTTCGLPNFQSDLQARVNAYRGAGAVCGGVSYPAVGALGWDGQLQNAATVHSTDMATNNFFSHTGSDGSTLRERVPAAGYDYYMAGENIAAGQTSVAQVMAEWMASPSHCANLMQSAYRDLGVSCKTNPASDYKIYWTMELGVRQ